MTTKDRPSYRQRRGGAANRTAAHEYPASMPYPRISTTMTDGDLDAEEESDITVMLPQVVGELASRMKTVSRGTYRQPPTDICVYYKCQRVVALSRMRVRQRCGPDPMADDAPADYDSPWKEALAL